MSYEYTIANSHVKSCYKNFDSYTDPVSVHSTYRGIRAPVVVSLSNSNGLNSINNNTDSTLNTLDNGLQNKGFELGFNDITRK